MIKLKDDRIIGLSGEMENYRNANGVEFFQMDTNQTFMYDAENDVWHNVTPGYTPSESESDPPIRLAVSPIIPAGIEMWGKTTDDLQKDIVVHANSITGTLKYVSDYSSAFGGDLAKGNYIALHFETPGCTGATVTVTVTNPVTLDEDMTAVLRIADPSTQTITVSASKSNFTTTTRVYSLKGLVCEKK